MLAHQDAAADFTAHEQDEAYQRMLAARGWIREWLSPQVIAAMPSGAPEVIGVHSPDVMRTPGKPRAR